MPRSACSVRLDAVLLLGLAACGDGAPLEPPDRLAHIEITADPASPEVRVGDSVAFTVRDSVGESPEAVRWSLLPGDTAASDHVFVFTPSVAGSYWVRAEATFANGREGVAGRAIAVQTNAAPHVAVAPLDDHDYRRVPVGDSIRLVLETSDPDDPTAALRTEWLESRGVEMVPLATGDTLRLGTDSAGLRYIFGRVRDPHGAYALQAYLVDVYDPITPPLWRARLGSLYWMAELSDGGIAGRGRFSGPLLTFRADGSVGWMRETEGRGPLAVGPNGTVYALADELLALTPSGDLAWRAPADAAGRRIRFAAVLPSSEVIGGLDPEGGAPGGLRWIRPDGALVRTVDLPEPPRVDGMAVRVSGEAYLSGNRNSPGEDPRRMVLTLVDPEGELRWTLYFGERTTSGGTVVPLPGGMTAFLADGIYGLDCDGEVAWHFPESVTGEPVVDTEGTVYFATGDRLRAVDGTSGQVLWEAALERPATATPILANDGPLFVTMDRRVIGLDTATRQVVWRHEASERLNEPLLTTGGHLVLSTVTAYVEVVDVDAGPMASSWPMAGGGPHRRRAGAAW